MRKILVCNAGSTSLKFVLYCFPEGKRLFQMKIGRIGEKKSEISYVSDGKKTEQTECEIADYRTGVEFFMETLLQKKVIASVSEISAVGFKTVFAEGYFGTHVLDAACLRAMERGLVVAPSHNRAYLQAICTIREFLPSAVLVGAFETQFHQTISEEKRVLPLPYAWKERYFVQKYGYHGASHSYIARVIAQKYGAQKKVISLHLGGSSSVCAIVNGESIDSSFGFSPQSGLFHVARCNEIDPSLLPWLKEHGMTEEEIFSAINKEAGLCGISGMSGDMRDLEKAYLAGNHQAMLAVNAFVYAIVKYIGAFYVLLGGMDILAFTGGMGENSSFLRALICGKLSALGICLSDAANMNAKGDCFPISESGPLVLVIPTDEERMVAERTYRALYAED